MSTWEIAILICIRDIGNEAMLQQIYRTIGKYIELGPEHLKETPYGGRPAYQHAVRSYISNLCDSGYLLRLDRGVYSITEKGKKRIDFDFDDLDI
jgi:hypothetical protein